MPSLGFNDYPQNAMDITRDSQPCPSLGFDVYPQNAVGMTYGSQPCRNAKAFRNGWL